MLQPLTTMTIPVLDTTFQLRSAEHHHRMAVQFMEQHQPIGARAARLSVGRAVAKLLGLNAALIESVDYAQDVPFASVKLAVESALRADSALGTMIAYDYAGQPNKLAGAAIIITVRGLR